jgi:hypothetical protein
MTPSVEQIEELFDLIREVDLPTLRALDRRFRDLLEQKEAATIATEQSQSAREDFHHRHPHLVIDSELFALVGIHPPNPVGDDKFLICEQITRRLAG